MKYKLLLVISALIVISFIVYNNTCLPTPQFVDYKIIRTLIGDKHYCLYVADETNLQVDGLSGKDLLEREGMYFKYPQSGYYRFWMKDMSYSLDLVFLEKDTVVDVLENIAPSTYPKTFTSSVVANGVIEMRAGEIQKHKIQKGQKIEF